MRLLFDQNLSHRLTRALADFYPGSVHVREVGLQAADDEVVWTHARMHGLIIVSKDSDFHQRSFVFGHPPKVIWIRRGNCSTAAVEQILRIHHADVALFAESPEGAFLALS